MVSGSRWLLEEAIPKARSTLLSSAAGCALAAGTLLIPSLVRQRRLLMKGIPWPRRRAALAGAFVLSGPALGSLLAGRAVSGDAGTLALALAPVAAAVAVGAYRPAEDGVAGRLWPGLAGLAGLMLLLPEPALDVWRMDLALLGMPLVAGAGAAYAEQNGTSRMLESQTVSDDPWGWMSLALAGAACLFLLIVLATNWEQPPTVFPAGVAADGLSYALTLFALHRAGAMRWSAQFLLTPLVTILEGVLVLKPTLTARSWTALFLLAAGGVYLLGGKLEGET